MAEPFDPNNNFDALSDFWRQQVAISANRALRVEAYIRMSPGDQLIAMIAGISTALVGAAFALVADTDEARDAVMKGIVNSLPFARQHAEDILNSGETDNG